MGCLESRHVLTIDFKGLRLCKLDLTIWKSAWSSNVTIMRNKMHAIVMLIVRFVVDQALSSRHCISW
jgi:hypothetical protein